MITLHFVHVISDGTILAISILFLFSGSGDLVTSICIGLISLVCQVAPYSVSMGYEIIRFQGDVDEELLCPICSGVLEEPLQVSGTQRVN
jgi:hypothetical protein